MAARRKSGTKPDLKRLAEQARTTADRSARKEIQAVLAVNVYDMRESGMTWLEIGEQLGWGDGNATGRMQFLYFQEDVNRDPSLAITGKTRADLAKKIVKARNAGLSWGKIAAYADISEVFAKNLYDEASGDDHRDSSIGKGGRRVGDGGGNRASRKPVAKTTAPKRGTRAGGGKAEQPAAKAPKARNGAKAPTRTKAAEEAKVQRPTAGRSRSKAAAAKKTPAQPAGGGARRPAARRSRG
jgi:hypothetical protein